jgi:hypothetical protein
MKKYQYKDVWYDWTKLDALPNGANFAATLTPSQVKYFCDGPDCPNSFAPQEHAGKVKRYCSSRCQVRHWRATHKS